ncbi:MAG: polysaccharide deacetylase family protein [Pseudomonadota bacterium]
MLSDLRLPIGRDDASRKLTLSGDFGRRFLITVDTEEEFDWDGPFKRKGHTTISVPKLRRFQEFVTKYGVKPVYFVDYSIIQDEDAVVFLKSVCEEDSADVGVHLHPWVNPPFDEETNPRNSFAGNLPPELEEAKLMLLCEAIEKTTGKRPVAYRAGRYGVGPHTVDILLRNGFLIDSSVRSRFDYSDEGGPDFTALGPDPIWLGTGRKLLEMPLTTVVSGMLRKQHLPLLKLMSRSTFLAAVISKLGIVERIPLTPEGISAREAREAIDVALDDGLSMLVFSFHSPSLSAGHTPYVRTSDDLDRFYDWWREIIGHLAEQNVQPASIDDLLAEANLHEFES